LRLRIASYEAAASLDAISAHLAGAAAGAVVELAAVALDEAGSSEQHAPQQPSSTARRSTATDPAVASVSERTRASRQEEAAELNGAS